LEFNDAVRVSLDCIPENRRKLLVAAISGTEACLVAMPRTVRDRALEDLQGLGLLEPSSANADHWVLTERANALLNAAG